MADQFSTITIKTPSVHLKVKSSICTSPLYRKEAWLRQKYLAEKLSARQIGALIGCSHDAVNRALKKFGMIREPSKHGRLGYEVMRDFRGRTYEKARLKTVKWMMDLRNKGLSYHEIAKRLNTKRTPTPSRNGHWHGASVLKSLQILYS
jgi:IS30 family transposase